jgi:type II secretory pathway pseudopilin PulG
MQAGKRPHGAAGFTYVAMLFALAIFGVCLAALGQTWGQRAQRDKEEELLLIGATYARAIGLYYQHSPGSQKRFPAALGDLLQDSRFVGTQRYLRKLYSDPVTGSAQWGQVQAPEGGISGVYSLSDKTTLRKRATAFADTAIKGERYADWKFVYLPRAAGSAPRVAPNSAPISRGGADGK